MISCVTPPGLSKVTNAFAALRLLPLSDRDKDVEILALRHQLAVVERQLEGARPRFAPEDRTSSLPCSIVFPSSASVGFDCW
ncbi:hypothetical protein GCM10017744_078880 [Streptomyces antimycoticus]|uniref:Uncharacterized protein n=1 Tax=Streptomyces antimycoticus TaxID=68175 RepID=A0A4D4K2R3_9ACTN|nr:hypothetical protein SANT12839_022520 [Streptomyces antimycoticus]